MTYTIAYTMAFRTSLIVLTTAMLSSCTSVVYAPSMMFISEPMKQHSAQISASGTALVESLPDDTRSFTTGGAFASIGYGFGTNWSMHLKSWTAFDGRGGVSASACLWSDSRQFWNVELGMANNNASMDGFATALRYGIREQMRSDLSLYGTIGVAFGWHDTKAISKGEWGLAHLTQVGFAYSLSSDWKIGLDLSVVLQYNRPMRSVSFAASPALGLCYSF